MLKPMLIIVAGATIVGLGLMSLHPRTPAPPSPFDVVDVEVGDRLERPDGVPWTQGPALAVVIVTSAKCPMCTAAVPFTERLHQAAKNAGSGVFYIVPSRPSLDDQAKGLRDLGRTVFRANLTDFGISRIPTALSVDQDGVVRSLWTGTVPAGREDEIVQAVLTGKNIQSYSRISHQELMRRVATESRYQVLAFSGSLANHVIPPDRYHVIPADEVAIRSKYELDPSLTTFVDCSTIKSAGMCQNVVIELVKSFPAVNAVDLPRHRSTHLRGDPR
jgi:hypothetical protein